VLGDLYSRLHHSPIDISGLNFLRYYAGSLRDTSCSNSEPMARRPFIDIASMLSAAIWHPGEDGPQPRWLVFLQHRLLCLGMVWSGVTAADRRAGRFPHDAIHTMEALFAHIQDEVEPLQGGMELANTTRTVVLNTWGSRDSSRRASYGGV
jgi:hypothetical protein